MVKVRIFYIFIAGATDGALIRLDQAVSYEAHETYSDNLCFSVLECLESGSWPRENTSHHCFLYNNSCVLQELASLIFNSYSIILPVIFLYIEPALWKEEEQVKKEDRTTYNRVRALKPSLYFSCM